VIVSYLIGVLIGLLPGGDGGATIRRIIRCLCRNNYLSRWASRSFYFRRRQGRPDFWLPGGLAYSEIMTSKTNVKVVSSRTIYRGPAFSVASDRVREPGGILVQRDVVRHSGSVVIMAIEEEGKEKRVLLVRQYRYAAGRYLWELPAGRIDEGETALAGGRRELLEETGYTAQQWEKALFFYSSPGFVDETMTVFLARGLKAGAAKPEEDEFISKRLFPISSLLGMIRSRKIMDAKTIAGVLWLKALSGKPINRKVRAAR